MAEVGRPLKFKTPEELQEKIEEYFSGCYEEQWVDETRRDDSGNWLLDEKGLRKIIPIKKLIQTEEFTITGLAIFLNTSRETLLDYQHKDEYSDTIKKAKLMVEKSYEERLIRRGNGGDIFALKNFNWKDKTETDITSDGKELKAITGFNYIIPDGNNNPDNQTPAEATPSVAETTGQDN